MSNVEVGNVVRPRSGGPWMTVTELAVAGSLATCAWFTGSDQEKWSEMQRGEFPVDGLVVAPGDQDEGERANA